jgi:hypothetical protein
MLLVFFVIAVGVWLMVPSGEGLCRSGQPGTEETAVITGNDHAVLTDYFARIERDKATEVPGDQVTSVLLRALPASFKKGCSDVISGWGGTGEAAAGMSVRMLLVEARRAEKTRQALIVYTCFLKGREADGRYRDERLAGIIIDGDSARLSMLPGGDDCGTCTGPTHIELEKTARIGGRGVIGVSFARTNRMPGRNPAVQLLSEENVRFYVMREKKIKPAGCVLKGREESTAEDAGQVKTVYSAGVVFKKDMRGNIIGILSPYRISKSCDGDGGARAASRVQRRGMLRYTWDAEREEFVKE